MGALPDEWPPALATTLGCRLIDVEEQERKHHEEYEP
jgi:hypothetical protein